jgi:S-adenosylmethionine:tRNA ribosyltransferase-isomerase
MELLVLVARDADFDALAQASKAIRIGSEVTAGGSVFRVLVDLGQGRYRFSGDVRRALERAGEVPLPPYIRRAPEPADADRYQTVYAREPGAVAAPTAGLHFTPELLDALRASGHTIASIWLAVGPGTFRPVRAARLAEHEMDEERFRVPPETAREIGEAKRQGRPVVAVGTTVVRALESMTGPGEGRTRLFIRPPFEFRTVDALLTNFHLPRSTLLALVAAFAGTERILTAYRAAVAERYRFYSYGDAMLIS